MKSFFYRYHLRHKSPLDANTAPRVVVLVDHWEASARHRLLQMHPSAYVMKVEQTPFDADCTPAGHPARRAH